MSTPNSFSVRQPPHVLQRGNALFLILIAVALFAALAYAVTQSGKGSGNISKEQLQLDAARMVQFGSSVMTAVNRMVLTGVPDTQISFVNNGVILLNNGTYNCWNDNTSCTTASCKVFDKSGGGVTPQTFEALGRSSIPGYPTTWAKPGHPTLRQLAINGIGTTAPDLIFEISGLTAEACNMINAKLGITTNFTNSSAAVEPVATSTPGNFSGCGTAAAYNTTHVFGDEDARFDKQFAFCAPMDSVAGSFNFNQVVLAR